VRQPAPSAHGAFALPSSAQRLGQPTVAPVGRLQVAPTAPTPPNGVANPMKMQNLRGINQVMRRIQEQAKKAAAERGAAGRKGD